MIDRSLTVIIGTMWFIAYYADNSNILFLLLSQLWLMTSFMVSNPKKS